ncbi:MAG: hypothetical protein H0U76_22310 [Ktedonobacteraceae bacterium]|nr:hypothetical protein [Ktedonobacteraceae bacterium]
MSELIARLTAEEEAVKKNAPVTYPLRRISSSFAGVLPTHVVEELLDTFTYDDVEQEHEHEADPNFTGPRWFFTQEPPAEDSLDWIGSHRNKDMSPLIWIGSRDQDISVLLPGSTRWLHADNHYLSLGSPASSSSTITATTAQELWVIQREDRVWLRLSPDVPAQQMDAVHIIRYLMTDEQDAA